MDISNISTYEYATLNATWHTLTVDEFKCREIEEALSNRKDAEVAIKYVRAEKGCGVISPTPKVEIDGIEYYSCLCHETFQDHSIHDSIWLHKQYEKGLLAYEGPLMDQPAKYIALMQLMDRLQAEHSHRLQQDQGS